MKQAELAHYRAILQAQAVEPPPRRRLFGPQPAPAVLVGEAEPGAGAPLRPATARRSPLFGRRKVEPEPAPSPEPLLLTTPVTPAPAGDLPLGARRFASEPAETPFHAEDLADPPERFGPRPGVIAGWSAARPPLAEQRLLRRLAAVLEAEAQGLSARLCAAEIAA